MLYKTNFDLICVYSGSEYRYEQYIHNFKTGMYRLYILTMEHIVSQFS